MNYSKLPDDIYSLDLFEFKWIIKELDEANNFEDKEIIFSIYFDLFYSIILPLSIYGDTTVFKYKNLLHTTMHNVIKLSKSRKDSVSSKSFIGNLIYYLNIKNEFKVSPIDSIIQLYCDDLDKIIQTETNIVNNFYFVKKKLDFYDKTHIIMCFKEYLSCLNFRISNLYTAKDTTEFKTRINNNLCLSLSEIIDKSNDLISFNTLLKEYTKSELRLNMDYDEFDFLNSSNEFIYEIINEFNDDELRAFRLYMLYKIAGYNLDDISNDKIDIDSFSKELGIDKNTCNKLLTGMKKKLNRLRFKSFFGLIKSKRRKRI